MNKKTKALTTEQYTEIIQTMKQGFCGCRPNERIATALVLEGNLGLRISDILKLRQCDIVRDGDRYRLEVVEQKTGKSRVFTVPLLIQQYIENYCLRNGIRRNDLIFPITERAVQKQLKIVCDYLEMEGVSTHSFRKWYATEIYNKTITTSRWCKGCCNTVPPPLRSDTSASSRRRSKLQSKTTHNFCEVRA